jgi:ParB/RepB/Spo0J family partition protein
MADGSLSTVRLVDPARIDPDPGNPRRSAPGEVFDVSDIVASIRKHGVIEPLIVGHEADGRFPLRHGERRLIAALASGRPTVPVIVGPPLTPGEVLAEQLVTNTHTPYAPLCEARAYRRLLEEHGQDVGEVAARIGRPPRLVRQRLALLALIPAAQELLGASPPRITLGLALRIAGLSPEGQEAPTAEAKHRWREGGEPVGVQQIDYVLRNALLRLRDAGFPTDDVALVPAAGACTPCPKRSGRQAEMFADGLADAELCTDKACFASKQEAHAARVTAEAKGAGVPVISAAEVKKLFPYGHGQLPHDSAFVDLDERCDLVRPKGEAPKNQGRHGGPEKCTGEGASGKHDFDNGCEYSAAEYDGENAATDDDNAQAVAAGCAAWVCCDHGCGAWSEVDARPGAPPAGWKPPTWREALASAGDAAKPALVAIVDDKAHPLYEKKAALGILRKAGVIGERDAANEVRNVTPPKKPGELDKFALESKEAAKAEATTIIAERAAKRAADAKFWRFLAGVVLRESHIPLDEALRRRGVEPEAGAKSNRHMNGDERKILLSWIVEQKEDGPLRGLVVELLVGGYGHDEDAPLPAAARFYGVDLDELAAKHKERLKAEAKERAKKKAEKTAKKGKAPKASPVTPPLLVIEKSAAAWKCACCGCTYEAACVDGAGGCEEVGAICSVCDRAEKIALKLCQKAQGETAVTKALATKQSGKGAPETFDKVRAKAVVAYLERTGALSRAGDKLLAKPA